MTKKIEKPSFLPTNAHWVIKLKKVQPKNSQNQINQFHENSIFCNFKNDQKSIFELGKQPKMQFHEKKMIYLISRVFLPGFLKFSGRYI